MTNNIPYNDVSSPAAAVNINAPATLVFSENIFQNPAFPYELWYQGESSILIGASNNWWGSTVSSVISSRIYDFYANGAYGVFDYSPYLNAPVFGAPSVNASLNLITTNVTWSGVVNVTKNLVIHSQLVIYCSASPPPVM